MKIHAQHISGELTQFFEEFDPRRLDLQTETVQFSSPVRVLAEATKITNALTVRLRITAEMKLTCSRCLDEFRTEIDKQFVLTYRVDPSRPLIDLDADIREEIILDYPINPLCRSACKGLCSHCGKNLNEGGCSCGTT